MSSPITQFKPYTYPSITFENVLEKKEVECYYLSLKDHGIIQLNDEINQDTDEINQDTDEIFLKENQRILIKNSKIEHLYLKGNHTLVVMENSKIKHLHLDKYIPKIILSDLTSTYPMNYDSVPYPQESPPPEVGKD